MGIRRFGIVAAAAAATFAIVGRAVADERPLDVVATTSGGAFVSLGKGPSIDDAGGVAFVGRNVNGSSETVENVFAAESDGTVTRLMNPVFELKAAGDAPRQTFGESVVRTNDGQVLARRYLTAKVQIGAVIGEIVDMPLTYLELWPVSGSVGADTGVPSQQLVMGDGGAGVAAGLVFFVNPATAGVYPSAFVPRGIAGVFEEPSINASGQFAMQMLVSGANQRATGPHAGSFPFLGGGVSFRYYPRMADTGECVFASSVRLYLENFDFSSLALIAGEAQGFTAVGTHPGISDDGSVVVFAGRHADMGEGIFGFVRDVTGAVGAPIKLAGVAPDGRIDPNEGWYDPDGSGPAAAQDVGAIAALRLDAPVAVQRFDATSGDEYVFAFLGDDADGGAVLQTGRLATSTRTPHGFIVAAAKGDTSEGLAAPIADIAVHDPLGANRQVAFWASLEGGGEAILKTRLGPVTHVLSFGVRAFPMVGDETAMHVRDAFAALDVISDADAVVVTVDQSDRGPAGEPSLNREKLVAAIADMERRVRPGDTFVLFLRAHGSWWGSGANIGHDEPPVDAESPFNGPFGKLGVTKGVTADEMIELVSPIDAAEVQAYPDMSVYDLRDDELADLFRTPKWDEVDKLFIFSVCFSGGLIGTSGTADSGDLGVLPRTAVIASSSESKFTRTLPPDPLTGAQHSVIGTSLVSVLGQWRARPSIGFYTLYQAIRAAGQRFAGLRGGHIEAGDRVAALRKTPMVVTWAPTYGVTEDFQIAGGPPRPEAIVAGEPGDEVRIEFPPLTSADTKGRKFTGAGVLHLADGRSTPIAVVRKDNPKKGLVVLTATTLKRDSIRFTATITASITATTDFAVVKKAKVTVRSGALRITVTDPAKVAYTPAY